MTAQFKTRSERATSWFADGCILGSSASTQGRQSILALLIVCIWAGALRAEARPRVIVTTDMKGPNINRDLDDIASMVRLLVYANEFDIEGLIAARACAGADNNGAATTRPDVIHNLIDRYAEVFPNLIKHADNYPSPSALHGVVRVGASGDPNQPCWKAANDMTAVGDGKSSEASQWIIEVVDRPDDRPVWVLVWGKSLDLAQALYDVRATRSPAKVEQFVSKLRVFDIWGQCECGGWIAHNFPGIFYIRSWQQVKGMSNPPGDVSNMQDAWINEHVRSGHGPLGAAYPPRSRQAGNVEGDSPSFLYLLKTGLSDPEHPGWGSWGGRMSSAPVKNVWAIGTPPIDREWNDFFMYDDVPDVGWKPGLAEDHALRAPIARWRDAFQRDFAVRMDWCVAEAADANHPPRPCIDGDGSSSPRFMDVQPGDRVNLSADESSDPDSDDLSYHWWRYTDADSYSGEISIHQTPEGRACLVVPRVSLPTTIHLVLEVTDQGVPRLTRYLRVILRVAHFE